MWVLTRRFSPRWADQAGEQVTPRHFSGSPVPDPAATCSSGRLRWQWFSPCASRPRGCSRDGSADDATRLIASALGSAYAGSANISSSTCKCDDGSTDQHCTSLLDWLTRLTAPAAYDVPVRSLAGPGEDAAGGDRSGRHLRNAPAGCIPTADPSNHNCLRLVLTRSKKITWYTDLFLESQSHSGDLNSSISSRPCRACRVQKTAENR